MTTNSDALSVLQGFSPSKKCAWLDTSFDELRKPYFDATPTRPFVLARLADKNGDIKFVDGMELLDRLLKNKLSSTYEQIDIIHSEKSKSGIFSFVLESCPRGKIPSHIITFITACKLQKEKYILAAKHKVVQEYLRGKAIWETRQWLLRTLEDFPTDNFSLETLFKIVKYDPRERNFAASLEQRLKLVRKTKTLSCLFSKVFSSSVEFAGAICSKIKNALCKNSHPPKKRRVFSEQKTRQNKLEHKILPTKDLLKQQPAEVKQKRVAEKVEQESVPTEITTRAIGLIATAFVIGLYIPSFLRNMSS